MLQSAGGKRTAQRGDQRTHRHKTATCAAGCGHMIGCEGGVIEEVLVGIVGLGDAAERRRQANSTGGGNQHTHSHRTGTCAAESGHIALSINSCEDGVIDEVLVWSRRLGDPAEIREGD
jgi:hypothetical protein